MSDIRRTVEQLLASPEHRSRLFAVELMGKNMNVFDPKDLTERLKLASLDPHPEVAKKAKLTMSGLLKQNFEGSKQLREFGIHSRLMNLTDSELMMEASAREKAAGMLEPSMKRVEELAKNAVGAVNAEALAVIGASCSIDRSTVLIAACEEPVRRTAAFEAFKRFRIPELGDLVLTLIDEAHDPADLAALAGVLGEAGVPSAVPVLAGLLKNADAGVRAAAAKALGKHTDEGAEVALIGQLTDASPAVLREVAESLAKVGRSATVDGVLGAWPKLMQPDVLAPTLRALGRARSSRGMAKIVECAGSPVPSVRAAVAQALGMLKLNPEQVAKHLVPLTADPELEVRLPAIKALYPHDTTKAAGLLKALLMSQKSADRAAAMSVMGDIQDPQAMEDFLVAMNTEQDKTVVAAGLDTLDKIADPRLIKSVRKLMAHPNPAVQSRAMKAFGRISGASGAKELDKLYDESRVREVKETVLAVLGSMCDVGTISMITKRLKEHDERLVTAAVEALDRVGSIENMMLLEPLLMHQSAKVRAAVVVALFHTGNFKCLSVLEEMLGKSDIAAQSAALSALLTIHDSLKWNELQKKPLLLTPLMEKAQPDKSISVSTSVVREAIQDPSEAGQRLQADASRPLPRATAKIQLDRTTSEEKALVKAVFAHADHALPAAKELAKKVLETQPQSELAHLMLQRLTAGTPEAKPLPAELLDQSTFLPLLGEETRLARAAHDTGRLLNSYFRIFERQLDVMRAVIEEGRDYLKKSMDAQAMEVAKFIVSQMQWTVDFDVRLGLICYDKHDWERAFTHLFRAFIASGGDPMIGVHLSAVSMKVRKRELAKAILGPILNGESVDPRVKERAMQVAQAITALEAAPPQPAS